VRAPTDEFPPSPPIDTSAAEETLTLQEQDQSVSPGGTQTKCKGKGKGPLREGWQLYHWAYLETGPRIQRQSF
jgi:hypothetical protein